MKRKVTIDRTDIVSPSRKKRIYHCNGFDNTPSEEVEIRTPYINEHEYESATTPCVSGCALSEPYIKCNHCFSKKRKNCRTAFNHWEAKTFHITTARKTTKGKKKTNFWY